MGASQQNAALCLAHRASYRLNPTRGKAYHVRCGSWLCENSSAGRARRNISKKLRTMESNRAPRTMFDTLLENCIFYISQLYEFLHRLGHSRPVRSKPHHGACPLRPERWGNRPAACGELNILGAG
jgi:hypothetical protein